MIKDQKTIQLIVNVNLLREIDERKLINAYAHHIYNDENDISNDEIIKNNLIQLLDWDKNGENGLAIYCGKFESIKRKDLEKLINFIKDNKDEIKKLSANPLKKRKLEHIKTIRNIIESKIEKDRIRCSDENYKAVSHGKKPKPCNYKGKIYSSRQECMYKEGITQNQLYRYLEKTGQV